MRKRILRRLLVGITLLLVPQLTTAQKITKRGTTSAKFLSIPATPRATALGGSYVAMATDASATFWNAAGLGVMQQSEVIVMHSNYFFDLNHNFVAAAFSMGAAGTWAVSINALTMPQQRVTTVADPEGINSGSWDAGSFAIGLSYGKSLTDRFSIGGTVKYIQEKIFNSSATALAIDIGTLFRTPFYGIRLGVNVSNFGQKLQIQGEDLLTQKDIDPSIKGNNESVNAFLATDKFDIPLRMQIGIAWDPLKTPNSRLTLLLDGLMPNDNNQSVNGGAELALLQETVFLRAGYQNLFLEQSENSFTVGVGFRYHTGGMALALDYAYAEKVHLNGVHQFGVSFGF